MKKRLRLNFIITALTLVSLIGCELYWVYLNAVNSRENFLAKASLTLRKSVDQYYLAQGLLPSSLEHAQSPTITYIVSDVIEGKPRSSKASDGKEKFTMTFQSVRVDKHNLINFKEIMARLIAQQKKDHLSLDTLRQTFQKLLAANGIKDQFKLSVAQGSYIPDHGQIAVGIYFKESPVHVVAELTDPTAFLIRTNLAPVIVSLVLILLSAGSLYYMRYIFEKHVQLDAMKSNFMNNIIHELRTPLTILRTSNEALSSFGAAGDTVSLDRYLGINTLVINELDTNIDRILEVSRSEKGRRKLEIEPVNLVEQVATTCLRFAPIEDAKIEVRSLEDPFEVSTDRFLMEVILSNLIDNGIKYSSGPARISVTLEKGQRTWSVIVRDQGIGIPADELPYIFDQFYRVPTGDLHHAKGYGIGLSYVRQVVTDLGGKISVESSVGVGTTFTITFNL